MTEHLYFIHNVGSRPVVNSVMDEVKVLRHPSIPESVISAHEVVTAGPDPVVDPTVAASRGTKRARRGV